MEILSEFDTSYVKKTKRRKRCPACGKLIQDGEMVHVRKVKKEGYYPSRGIMGFVNWQFTHTSCWAEHIEGGEA